MSEAAELSVLQRKIKPKQPGLMLSAMTVKKAMRLAVARAAEKALGCAVTLLDISETLGAPEDLTALMPNPALLMRLQGPVEARGLAVLCPQTVAAVIETQTVGRVLAGKAADRKPTRTDAILVAEFLDLVLSGFAALASDCAEPPPVSGYVSSGREVDMRTANMTLSDVAHIDFSIALDFANGAKSGQVHLLLPAAQVKAALDQAVGDFTLKISNAVLGSTARLEAVLCRQRLTLSRLTGLAVGDVVQLDAASLERVAICGPGGQTLLYARLGRSGAARALRIVLESEGPSRLAPANASPEPVADG